MLNQIRSHPPFSTVLTKHLTQCVSLFSGACISQFFAPPLFFWELKALARVLRGTVYMQGEHWFSTLQYSTRWFSPPSKRLLKAASFFLRVHTLHITYKVFKFQNK